MSDSCHTQNFLRRIAQLDKSNDNQLINSVRIVNPAVMVETGTKDVEVRMYKPDWIMVPCL